MSKKVKTYHKARLQILNFITQCCLSMKFPSGSYSLQDDDKCFHGTVFDSPKPPVGSLCIITCAPDTKYYLSWLMEIKNEGEGRFSQQYLLKSIEDGSLCWWHNVGIWNLPLETSNKRVMWKWDDDMFAFQSKVDKACAMYGNYSTVVRLCEFGDGNSVTVSTRERFGDEITGSVTFPNYKKVTYKMLEGFYNDINAKKLKKE